VSRRSCTLQNTCHILILEIILTVIIVLQLINYPLLPLALFNVLPTP
jgi:hypothetical protein